MIDDDMPAGTNTSNSEPTAGNPDSSAWTDGQTTRFAIVGSDRRTQKLAISLLAGDTQISILTSDAKTARTVLNEIGERLDNRATGGPIVYTREALQRIRVTSDLHRMGRHAVVFLFLGEDGTGSLQDTLALVEASVGKDTPVAVLLSVHDDVSSALANAPNPGRIVPVYSLLPEFEGSVFFPVHTEANSDTLVNKVAMGLKGTGHAVLTTSHEDPLGTIGDAIASWVIEALRWLDEKKSDVATIDDLFRLGSIHGLGPLQFADLMGLDFVLSALEDFGQRNTDRGSPPTASLVARIQAGNLGWKSGRGFYVYENG